MNKFYVYILLNPLKPGKFIYDNLEFEYEPFYVGKGSGHRYMHHTASCNIKHCLKSNIIKKILKEALKPVVFIHKGELLEIEAFDEETRLILLIGRRNLNCGPLANLSNGGEGNSGKIVSLETREKIRLKNIGNKYSLGRKHTSEELEKMRNAVIGRKLTEETKRKIGEKSKGRLHKEESKLKIAEANYIPINQYDLEGNFIKEWPATTVASKELSINMTSIRKCCHGTRNKAGNFIFKFKN